MSVLDRFEDWRERVGGTSVLLSVLVHLILALLILTDIVLDHDQPKGGADEPPAVEVSLVPPPQQPPPQPQQQQQPQPEPPKPQPEPEPEPPKPMARPSPPIPEPPKPLPKPVLDPGKLAKDSKAGTEDATEVKQTKHSWLDDAHEDDAPKAVSEMGMAAKAVKPTEAMAVGKGAAHGDDVGQATQSERDYLLTQILKPWRNRPNYNWPSDAVVRLRVQVMPDGYLAAPFNARQRYAPDLAIVGYYSMSRDDPRRVILESLYSVLRVAQPLTLPPELKAKAPFLTVLDFKLVDIP